MVLFTGGDTLQADTSPGQTPPLGRHLPWADTSPGQTPPLGRHLPWADTSPGQTPPLGRHLPWADTSPGQTPPDRHAPWADMPPGQTPPGHTPTLGRHPSRWLQQRTVRILLECILVSHAFGLKILTEILENLYKTICIPGRSECSSCWILKNANVLWNLH